MIRLRVIMRFEWTVLGVVDRRGRCALADFLVGLAERPGKDASQVLALIARVAACGPPRNERRSRQLEGPIYEFKTRSGIRIPYFYDEGRIIVCTEALRKPGSVELRRVIARTMRTRDAYLRAKSEHALVIEEEDQ